MRKIKLQVQMCIDGFVKRPDGELDCRIVVDLYNPEK